MPAPSGPSWSDAGSDEPKPIRPQAAAVPGVADPWSDDSPPRRLSREEAQALSLRLASVSPWRVVAFQCVVGAVAASVGGGVAGSWGLFWSVLYGAAIVIVPAALMARGLTSPLSRMSPGAGAVSFMLWEFVKILVSVAMLALAPKVVPALSWLGLLAGLVLCIKVYWLALLWRRR